MATLHSHLTSHLTHLTFLKTHHTTSYRRRTLLPSLKIRRHSSTSMATSTTDTPAEAPTTGNSETTSDVIVQYVVLRRDLIDTWPLGSVVTQGCHASVAAIWTHKDDPQTIEYCSPDNIDSMHKVTLEVKGEVQLKNLSEKLTSNNIDHKLWIEQPENYPTCLATKPYPKSLVSMFFKKLKLFTHVENEEEVQEVPIIRRPTKAEKKTWTPVEEEALAKAWVHISTCRVVGNEQSREGFWRRIHEHFKHNVPDTARSHHGLNTKWKSMHGEMGVFNGLYIQQNRLRESGCGDVDVMKNTLADYKTKTGKAFTHIEAWEIVRHEDKWVEQPDVGQGSSSHSDKRRKSSESGHYETASTDNTVIPDLNDDTMPRIQKRKGKKAESESSSKGSVAMSFDAYTSRKTQILESMAEKKAAKDEMAEKLMATKIRVMEEKAMFRALNFFKEPHDNITDSNVLAITLGKKREIAEKYGWTCDF